MNEELLNELQSTVNICSFKDNNELEQNHDKYALIYSDINSRFEGKSYVKKYSSSIDELKKFVEASGVQLLNDADYIRLVQKKKQATFYMIEES